jgi:hypothetical protein
VPQERWEGMTGVSRGLRTMLAWRRGRRGGRSVRCMGGLEMRVRASARLLDPL